MVRSWTQYLNHEPDVGTRLDVAIGIIGASNLWAHQKRGQKTKPHRLMPRWGRKSNRNSGMAFLAWAASNGAKIDDALVAKLKG